MRQDGGVATSERLRDLEAGTVVPVWAMCLIAAVVIGVASPASDYFVWLPIALAAAVLVTFAIQLSTLTKEGFVNRVMASVAGGAVILAVATAVLWAVSLANG
jgi:hypothetical protein